MTVAESAEKLYRTAVSTLPFKLLDQQDEVLKRMCLFAVSDTPGEVFVLNGYAGTGKTSLVGALIKALDASKRKTVVLAPTGRGAKVASGMSAHPAGTIHRRLFRPDMSDASGMRYVVAPNQSRDTLFIVDEASLIADSKGPDSLLAMLVKHV